MKEVRMTARFPEPQYARNGVTLELHGFGAGSTLAIAMNRAFRSMLANPQMHHKVPKWIYISVATIHFPSGRVKDYVNHGEGMPAVGSQYLFFLVRPDISEPEYEVIIGGAYELRNGIVHPLDDFNMEFDNTSEAELMSKVRVIESPTLTALFDHGFRRNSRTR